MENQELTRLLNLEEWDTEDELIALNFGESERIYLAKNIKKYDGILIDLSHDRNLAIREAVASNNHTPISILKRLYTSDGSDVVRTRAQSTLKELGE